MWLPKEWVACWRVIKSGRKLVRMTHGSLSPLYLKCQSPLKKWLVGPIKRFFLRRCAKIVVTCEAEKEWIEKYLGKRCPAIEVTDIKRFFKLGSGGVVSGGVEELGGGEELSDCQIDGLSDCCSRAGGVTVQSDNQTISQSDNELTNSQLTTHNLQLKIVSSAFGDEKEKIWSWCDVLVLPTLSDNFGLVVAEALERGKRVITTDGAPAWGDGNTYGGRLVYLQGFRDGTPDVRVRLLRDAIERMMCHSCGEGDV